MSFTVKKIIMLVLAAIFILALLLFQDFLLETTVGKFILFAYIIAYSIFCIVFWRCKHCKRSLGKLSMFAKYCPHCGDEL